MAHPSQYRPNVLAWLLGALVIAAGIGVAALGVQDFSEVWGRRDMFTRRGARAQADALGWIIWGIMIFTVGCYIWRAARTRGLKDRSGRVLLSIGYLVLAFAMSEAVHAAMGITGATSEAVRNAALLEAGKWFVGLGAPAALLVAIGVKMADEIVITTVSGNVEM